MARWGRLGSRGNVEDRRGSPGAKVAGGVGGLELVRLESGDPSRCDTFA